MSLVLHACAAMPEGGRLLIETAGAEIPVVGRMAPHTMLAITYTGDEPDAEKLFEPCSAGEEAMALSMVHAIAVEHGGYLSARVDVGRRVPFRDAATGRRRRGASAWSDETNGARHTARRRSGRGATSSTIFSRRTATIFWKPRTVTKRWPSRSARRLAGHTDRRRGRSRAIAAVLRASHPHLRVLEMADPPASEPHQIARPFTQQALLDRVRELLKPDRLAAGETR